MPLWAGTARLVNLAGRQRALAQRLAKNYFLTAARLDGKAAQEQMKADAAEFRQSMATLVSAVAILVQINIQQPI